METKYFNLTDGSLEFNDKKLIIFDKEKGNNYSLIATFISMILMSISHISRGLRKNDNTSLFFGIFCSLIWVLGIFKSKYVFFKVENEYQLNDIKHVNFSINKMDNSIIATLFTKKNRKRRIKLVNENNQDFILQNLFLEHQISVD